METKVKSHSFAIVSLIALLSAAPALADDNVNTSNIDQVGSNIIATATQTGAGNTSLSNIDQGLGVPGTDLLATVTQQNVDNVHEAHIIQDGALQTGVIDQGGDHTDNYALIRQDGILNDASILQNGTHNFNSVEITQTGGGVLNMATVDQGGMDNSNTAGVMQDGNNLLATIVQN
jgi:hypothetical protein